MFSIARSRLTIPAQISFLAVNTIGVFMSIIYNAKTPDLYPNNAHHKIGWVATWVAAAWFVMAFPMICYRRKHDASHPMTSQNMAQYERLQHEEFAPRHKHRFSRDSGHGSDHSATLCSGSRSQSQDSFAHHKLEPQSPLDEECGTPFADHEGFNESSGLFEQQAPQSRVARLFALKCGSISLAGFGFRTLKFFYVAIERTILLLAFIALLTGGVTFSNLFRDRLAFSGAAHFVKGGIFFWYGILTLGRWMGAFADYGWAWNIRPRSSTSPKPSSGPKWMPTAEFVESFVIWLYGASNVFLEHLNAWGQPWHMEDFQHVSITIMFFGGGLLGMLVESETMRALLNTNVVLSEEDEQSAAAAPSKPNYDLNGNINVATDVEKEQGGQGFAQPKTYKHSLNPMPALVILLLGKLMGAHHQASAVSTVMHSQWGNLFVGFAIARAASYALLYISPPTSYFPSRPPTELVASFCLISGGMIFMGSATDTVRTIEQNGLDAMFLFTVAMGFTGLIMAWVAVVFATKGWALRRERKRV